jgi:hypothetical protein
LSAIPESGFFQNSQSGSKDQSNDGKKHEGLQPAGGALLEGRHPAYLRCPLRFRRFSGGDFEPEQGAKATLPITRSHLKNVFDGENERFWYQMRRKNGAYFSKGPLSLAS